MNKYKTWNLQALRDEIYCLVKTITFLEAELREMRKEKFRREQERRARKALKVIAK